MSTVRDIADHLLHRADEDGNTVTHLKLQKLCYYAQGYSLALLSEPMFDEPIEAWEHGPVVRELWNQYKTYGKAPIGAPSRTPEIEPYRAKVLEEVHRRFGWMTAWDLRNRTHDEVPWREAWFQPENDATLNLQTMRDFFRGELRKSRRTPQPVDRSTVLALLENDNDLRNQVIRSRREFDAGRSESWD